MQTEIRKNIQAIDELFEEGFRFAVRDEDGTLVVSNNQPVKYPNQGEWGLQQAIVKNDLGQMRFNSFAKKIDRDLFKDVQYENDVASNLEFLMEKYRIALDVLISLEGDEDKVDTSMLEQLYDAGIRYVFASGVNILLYPNEPEYHEEFDAWASTDIPLVLEPNSELAQMIQKGYSTDHELETLENIIQNLN